MMLNNTVHEPSFLQAPDYRPALAINNFGTSRFNHSTDYHVNIASLKRIGEWLIFLKSENVYDNTRIILVSDHGPGSNFVKRKEFTFNLDQFNPLLMMKDFNAGGAIKINNNFMSNADVPELALQDIIENPINPFTGNLISSKNKSKPLYITRYPSNLFDDPFLTQFPLNPDDDFYIHDDIFNPLNWEKATIK
jgi:hypothetical protein